MLNPVQFVEDGELGPLDDGSWVGEDPPFTVVVDEVGILVVDEGGIRERGVMTEGTLCMGLDILVTFPEVPSSEISTSEGSSSEVTSSTNSEV